MRIDGCVALISDHGLGGANVGGVMFRALGAEPLLLHSPVGEDLLDRWRESYTEVVVLDAVYDPAELARAAAAAAERAAAPLRGLFSAFDGLLIPAATAAAKLGLPHPSLDGLRRCRTKYLMRQVSRDAGLPTPRFALLGSRDDAEAVAAEVGLPAVVKPVNGTAGHLVRLVDDVAGLRAAYDEITARITDDFAGLYSTPLELDDGSTVDARTAFLVEEQMQGEEYSMEFVMRDGAIERVVMLDKCFIEPGTRFEEAFTWPPALTPDEQEAMWRLTEDTIAAIGLEDTIAHVEAMQTPDGPRLLEINAGRTGGGYIPMMPPRIVGIDMPHELLALACGLPTPERAPVTPPENLTNLTIYPKRNGTLVAIHGLDAVAALDCVSDVSPAARPGQVIDLEREVQGMNCFATDVADRTALRALYDRICEIVEFEFAD